jgi:hypothetical protein
MDDLRDQKTRERAYQIWLDEGQPNGEAEAHWLTAESELGGDRATIAAETDYVMQTDEASASATRQQLSDRDGPADLMSGSVAPRTTDAARAARTGERAHLDRPST